MSKQRIGALIVVEKNVPLYEIIRTGEVIDANVNQRLIENIFFKNSPLHDSGERQKWPAVDFRFVDQRCR